MPAWQSGLTPSSILLDAPIVIDQGPGLGKWKPVNYSNQFYGPSTLRLGLEKSRNVMTVRLAQTIGMDRVVDMAERFDLERGLGHNLAAALGANEVNLLELTTAYAMLVNGGKRHRAGPDRAHPGPPRQDRDPARRARLPRLPGCRLAGPGRPRSWPTSARR